MLIRIRQGKRAVPERFRTMANQARKRFTMYSSKTEDNELYAVNDSPPPAYPGQVSTADITATLRDIRIEFHCNTV